MAETRMPQRGTVSKTIYRILIVVFGVTFFACVTFLIRDFKTKQEAEQKFQELLNQTTEAENEMETEAVPVTEETEIVETEIVEPSVLETLGIVVPDLSLDWIALEAENEDIYSWIHIPGTNVSYPVLQHPTEHDYYLKHNLDHSKGLPGCIYTQKYNTMDYTDKNTILYGHNMKNGTMFKTLHEFEEKEFFDANRYIYIYLPEKVLVYQIYAACEFTDDHLLYKYDFSTIDGTNEFIEYLNEAPAGQALESMEVTEETKLITLSTCIANRPTKRWIVVGVLLGEQEVVTQ